MSYDVVVRMPDCPTCGACRVYTANPTYNLADMFREAFGGTGLREFEGKKARDVLPILERGIADMRARPDHYRTFDSPNGWGTYDGNGYPVVDMLDEFAAACRRWPDAEVSV